MTEENCRTQKGAAQNCDFSYCGKFEGVACPSLGHQGTFSFLFIRKGGVRKSTATKLLKFRDFACFSTGIWVDVALPRHKEVGVHWFASEGRAAAQVLSISISSFK